MSLFEAIAKYPTFLYVNHGAIDDGFSDFYANNPALHVPHEITNSASVAPTSFATLAELGIKEVLTVTELHSEPGAMLRGIGPFRHTEITRARPITVQEIMPRGRHNRIDGQYGVAAFAYDAVISSSDKSSLSLRWLLPNDIATATQSFWEAPCAGRSYLEWLVMTAKVLSPKIKNPNRIIPQQS